MAVADVATVPGAGAGARSTLFPAIAAEQADRVTVRAPRITVSRLPRVLILLASVLMIGVYIFPLWNVRLTAPQYPEGLGMQIRINTVEGATENDLNYINNLNHYIGMKRIEPDAIPELRIMPWIVAAIIVTGLATAALAKRKVVYAWTAGFLAIAAIGLIDFWKWEYDYGHHLDSEHAILKIPGMTYQPPLIGAKQLLNFRAVSLPSVGGILAGVALALAATAVVMVWRERKLAMARS
jgi:copper chaperone NosL